MRQWLHLLLLPHPDNNHRARLLQPGSIALFIAIYLLNQSFLKSLSIVRPGVLGYSSEITAQKVVDLTNAERGASGLPPLTYNTVLEKSATAKAKDMFQNNYWAHNSPQGKIPWDFFDAAGYKFSVAGENLARDFLDTDSMMRAWMKSPTHRANIVHKKYQEIGVGVVNGILNGVKTTLVVQHFGTPVYVANDTPSSDTRILASVPASTEITDLAPQVKLSINPIIFTQVIGSLLFIFILGLLLADAYVTVRHQHHRLTSSSLGHIGFLFIILLLLIFSRQGVI